MELVSSILDLRSSGFCLTIQSSARCSPGRLVRHGRGRLRRQPGRRGQLRRVGRRRGVQKCAGRAGTRGRSGIGQDRAFRDHRLPGHGPATFGSIAIAATTPAQPRPLRPAKATTASQQQVARQDHRHPTCTDHEMGSFVRKNGPNRPGDSSREPGLDVEPRVEDRGWKIEKNRFRRSIFNLRFSILGLQGPTPSGRNPRHNHAPGT
jgi:hypothetical protein